MTCARDNVAWAAGQAARAGCEVLIEALNPADNGPCLVTTTAAAAAFAADVGQPNVRLQYDAYHMQRTEGDLTATIDAYWPLISHIQIADVPGRHEPGTGEINYPFVLDHLERKGYRGAVGLEYQPSGGDRRLVRMADGIPPHASKRVSVDCKHTGSATILSNTMGA